MLFRGVKKKMIRLLRHDPSVLREEDGAVEFRILAPMFRSEFSSSQHWSIRTWLNYLQKGGGPQRGDPWRTLQNLREPWRSSANLHEPWRTLQNLREPWRTSTNLNELVQTWANLRETQQTLANLSEPQRTLANHGEPQRTPSIPSEP